jgi:hypothetical protein
VASDVEICNRALQKLGAKRIVSLSDDSVNARACNSCYTALRDAELEDNSWTFSIQRYSLAADAVAPSFGPANSYALPAGHLRLLPPYPVDNSPYRDWMVESGKVLTNDSSPLNVRCVMQITDANAMHPLFREALSTKIAFELCEELTQSNTKKEALRTDYEAIVRRARKANAIESVPAESAEDPWITGRS